MPVRSVDGANLESTENPHVDGEGVLAAKVVAEDTKDGSAYGAEQKSEGDGS